MSDIPDLTGYGYKVVRELGCNREGGRVTWQGIALDSQLPVVIKQFCFARSNSSWSGYKACLGEVETLRQLDYPNIPQYLDSIDTESGFCLVQEYISASSCSNYRKLSVAEVKQIALDILDILVYLQQQQSPILHQDIKPDNILLDESLKPYLIDFGFSRTGSEAISGSSVFKGTPGFIPPEQVIQPTTASDIYSLGITLVCLLTQKNIDELKTCIDPDNPYELLLEDLLPELEAPFFNWLEKAIAPRMSQRFPDALTAKNALLKLNAVLAANDTEAEFSMASNVPRMRLRLGLATAGIFSLSTATVWSLGYTLSQIKLSIGGVAIATLAAIAIGIAQLGALTIANWDESARRQGIVLGLLAPIVLVLLSGTIWGIEEAVMISVAIELSEVLLLSYCWWQIPQPSSPLFKAGSWLMAIACGITFGLQLI